MYSVLNYNVGAMHEVTGNNSLSSPSLVCGACQMVNNKNIIQRNLEYCVQSGFNPVVCYYSLDVLFVPSGPGHMHLYANQKRVPICLPLSSARAQDSANRAGEILTPLPGPLLRTCSDKHWQKPGQTFNHRPVLILKNLGLEKNLHAHMQSPWTQTIGW